MGVVVKFKRMHPKAQMPRYQTAGAAGMDLHAVLPEGHDVVELWPGEFKVVLLGFGIELPEGYEAQFRPRSGLAAKKGISIVNSPATIDADFRGELGVTLINHGSEKLEIRTGDRIAQMVVKEVPTVYFVEVSELSPTDRGEGKLGSTGVSG
jgi:dUTP pyrophosphatase